VPKINEIKFNKISIKAQAPLPRLSERLERLLDDAERLFTQDGFWHLSTDDLAQQLHCSKRTLYSIARGRENFFATVITRRMARLEHEQIARVEAAPNVEAAILVCVESMVDALENISPIYLRDLMRFPPGERAVGQTMRQITDALARVIEQGERQNLLRKIEPRLAAEALLAAVRRTIEPDFLAASHVTSAEAVRQVYRIFWFGVQARPKGRRSPATIRSQTPSSRRAAFLKPTTK
jgi:AcrR family transcriptional regulator